MRSLNSLVFRCGILLLIGIPCASAQLISAGLKAGIPLTEAYSQAEIEDGGSAVGEDRFTIGRTAEINFPFHLSFEVDALYRRNSFSVTSNSVFAGPNINEWQIPFLGKYEAPIGPLRPFVDAGVVYRHVSANQSAVVPFQNANTSGFAIGGGIGLKLSRLRISPEIRYTHWGQPSFSGFPGINSQNDQADFLVGVTF